MKYSEDFADRVRVLFGPSEDVERALADPRRLGKMIEGRIERFSGREIADALQHGHEGPLLERARASAPFEELHAQWEAETEKSEIVTDLGAHVQRHLSALTAGGKNPSAARE